MIVGIPKEVKIHESRVGLVPAAVAELVDRGHEVLVETNAGVGVGIADADYERVGATIAQKPEQVFEKADLIVKVKDPLKSECKMLRKGQILFTYLHLAALPEETELLQKSGCAAIAYETVTDDKGGLPLLSPMSEVAGRMSIQAGAHALEKVRGGRGILLGGVPGVPSGDVMVLGGGVVGTNAIRMAMGLEANVTVLDKSLDRLRQLNQQYGSRLKTIYATKDSIREHVLNSSLIIGAILIPGAAATKLVTRDMLKDMRTGAVMVDVAIDQGGCFETSKPTTHEAPTYVIDDVVHYCVTNMPGAVPRTSTLALGNATLPFIIALADKGLNALLEDKHLLNGLNVYDGHITCPAVAKALNKECVAFSKFFHG